MTPDPTTRAFMTDDLWISVDMWMRQRDDGFGVWKRVGLANS